MKSNEILEALKLIKNQRTNYYCGKLASVFEFLKKINKDVIGSGIIETGLSINDEGKALTPEEIRTDMLFHKNNDYKYNDPEIEELSARLSSTYAKKRMIRDMMHKKRKNKDNSVLEGELADAEKEADQLEQFKDGLIRCEEIRLESVVFPIGEMRTSLNLFEGVKIKVETGAGDYSFNIPTNNKFYFEICKLLSIPVLRPKEVTGEPIYKIIVNPEMIECIKKAAKFTSTNDLRPAMMCVCLDFSDKGLQVVSTDAHRLYYSKYILFESMTKEPFQLLISPESVKKLCKSKIDYSKGPVNIYIYSDTKALINSIECELAESSFPDYRQVIPVYETELIFNRKEFINKVAQVKIYANKSTQQVTIQMNGELEFSAQEINFSFESKASMPFISKTFGDATIAFNGDFLIDVLATFKEDQVKMITEGSQTKGVIFTNGIDRVLLMPLMQNN